MIKDQDRMISAHIMKTQKIFLHGSIIHGIYQQNISEI